MTERSPIILIGAARSGTKFLRDVLASGTHTAAVPYDVNYVWRYGNESADDDLLDPTTLDEKKASFIRNNLRTLARAAPNDTLIEKTVAKSLRVPFVDTVFSEARYVHLVRDGRDVTESSMRQWSAPPDWSALERKLREIPVKNLDYVAWFGWNLIKGLFSGRKGGKVWGPRFADIERVAAESPLSRVCAHQWRESVERASADLARVDNAKSRVFTIRYEDLVRDDKALVDLIEKLALPDRDAILDTYRAKLRPNQPGMWRNLSSEDLAIFNEILTQPLEQMGYLP